MKKIKILRILLSVGETSGPYNILSLPLADKHDITICTYFKTNVVVPESIRLIDGNDTLTGFILNLKTAFSLEKYDIIHAHSPHVGFLHLLFTLFRPRNVKIPKVFTMHCTFDNLKFRNKLLLIPILFLFESIVFCSNSARRSVPSCFLRIAHKKVSTIKNGADLFRIDQYIKKMKVMQGSRNFNVVSIGRYIESKNYDVLIDSYRRIQDDNNRLTIIGDGPLLGMLSRNIREIGLEKHVKLTGMIPRDDVYGYLAKSSIYVSTSIREGMPVAVLEAMACKCPVVLSDIPSHREIANGVDFIPLIACDNPEGFAQEIRRMRGMSPPQREKIGERCRKLVEEKFSSEEMHQRYIKLYRKINENEKTAK